MNIDLNTISKDIDCKKLESLLIDIAKKCKSIENFYFYSHNIAEHVYTIPRYKNDFQSNKRRMIFYTSNIEYLYKKAKNG